MSQECKKTLRKEQKIKSQLIDLYQKIAEHTKPECQSTCRAPLSCCSYEYCEAAVERAEQWGVVLERLKDWDKDPKRLWFMGKDGCVVPPHLRPLCSVHTCQISAFGAKPGDPKWTKKYYDLRNKIDTLELDLLAAQHETK